jgi:polysaccharide biosynthesis/export protein
VPQHRYPPKQNLIERANAARNTRPVLDTLPEYIFSFLLPVPTLSVGCGLGTQGIAKLVRKAERSRGPGNACALWLHLAADIMRPSSLEPTTNAGTLASPVERAPCVENRVPAGKTVSYLRPLRSWAARAAIALLFPLIPAVAQVPIPVQEQVQLFNSLPPAQQQALIRELQRSLPPAQRQAIIQALQQQGGGLEDADAEGGAAVDDQGLPVEGEGSLGLSFGEEDVARLRPRSTLVIEFSPRPDAPIVGPGEQQRIDDFRDRLARANPYQLDGAGVLYLPGVPAIELAGLNVDEATVRVRTEPQLAPFSVALTFLPLDPELRPFGYDLFRQSRRLGSGVSDVSVPADYVIGPGDTVNIQLFGNENMEYFLPVSREGTISFPDIGPLNVSGLSFEAMRTLISNRVQQQMIGVQASVTLGELRSLQVFVLGDVQRPGSYTVNGLAAISNALFASGGIRPIGSLRNIALRRDGNTVVTLDLYDFLLRGDTRSDVRIQPGDAIFVPPVGPTVAVHGEVRRPAIYEVKNEQTVADILALAGGLNPNANRSKVKLERVVPNRGTTVQDIDLATNEARTVVQDGDVLRIQPNLEQVENSVRLAGNVFQPGPFQWFEGMRLRDLLPSPELVKRKTDLNYVLIRREVEPNVGIQVLSADLALAWQQPAGPANVPLRARDTVYVFSVDEGRQDVVTVLVDELAAQAPPNTPVPIARVGGQVRAPGEYPLEPGMRVSDLLRAGGGMSDAAYATDAELTRYEIVNGEYRETELVTVNIAGLLRGDQSADLTLAPYDFLSIKEVSRWRGEESVTLRGEVTFPGTYPIRRGETLSSVLARAGGLTDLAFPEGSVFTRVELREREQRQIELLASRIERDIAALSVTEPQSAASISTGQALASQLRSSVPTGRWAIRLDEIVGGRAEADIIMKDGDELIVPDQRQEVTVLGEVQYAASHVFDRALSRDDYIDRSGGLTQRADKRRVYVVRANGEVVAGNNGAWFRRDAGNDIRPGDSIVVPLDVDQPLGRWAAISQIVYSLAIGAAAVNSF